MKAQTWSWLFVEFSVDWSDEVLRALNAHMGLALWVLLQFALWHALQAHAHCCSSFAGVSMSCGLGCLSICALRLCIAHFTFIHRHRSLTPPFPFLPLFSIILSIVVFACVVVVVIFSPLAVPGLEEWRTNEMESIAITFCVCLFSCAFLLSFPSLYASAFINNPLELSVNRSQWSE